MRFILSIQKYGAVVGLRPFLPNQKTPFNSRNVKICLVYSLLFVSSTAFLVFDANLIREYAEAFLEKK